MRSFIVHIALGKFRFACQLKLKASTSEFRSLSASLPHIKVHETTESHPDRLHHRTRNMKSIALTLLLLGCLLAVVCATPGKVIINGKCVDCNRPDGDDSVIIPEEHSSAVTQSLTTGSVMFGLLYYIASNFLRN